MMSKPTFALLVAALLPAWLPSAVAQTAPALVSAKSAEDLAKEPSNPIANLISLPIQYNSLLSG